MKEKNGKLKLNSNNLPKILKTEGKTIYKENDIAEEFNNFFTNIGPKLAEKIPPAKNLSKIIFVNLKHQWIIMNFHLKNLKQQLKV